MDPYSMGLLALIQAMRMGMDVWERHQRGEMTPETLAAEIDRMEAALSGTRARLHEEIARRREQQPAQRVG